MRRLILMAILLAGPSAWPVRAHDLLAPCWRGQPGSTHQAWGFGSNATNPVPEVSSNAFGAALAHVQPGAFASGWFNQLPTFGTNQSGYWDLGRTGTVTLTIPNDPAAPAHSWKYVSVQVTQWRDGGIYNQYASVALAGATYLGGQRQLVQSAGSSGGWWLDQTLWRLEPCPASETVVLTSAFNGSVIDHVVVDTVCATVACPPNLVVSTDAGQCSRSNVTWTLPPLDGCTITNFVCAPPSGSAFPVGTNTVTCAVTDSVGQTADCAFLVVVLDAEAPTLSCADMVISIHSGDCGQAVVNYSLPATDNCALGAVECVPPSGFSFPVGTNAVSCVATDLSGHTTACAFQVVVQETTVAYEGDVAGRPFGNGMVSVADWVLVGRMAANLDECTNACECVKADCAPRPCGNGTISIQDWVQAGRYAAVLDPLVPACGPVAGSPLTLAAVAGAPALAVQSSSASEPRTLAVRDLVVERGQTGCLPVVLEATGDESALGLSLGFDRALLTFVSASLGSNALSATLLVNSNQAALGRLGLAMMLPPGLTFDKGSQAVFEVCFRAAEGTQPVASTLTLSDQPIPREVVDATANRLTAGARPGAVLLTRGAASAFASITKESHGGVRLKLLGAPGSMGGLERSLDLIRWERIANVTNHTGILEFTDPAATGLTQRFYRAVSP
jgi:hypothetical protein